MAVVKRSDAERMMHEALVLDLGDLARHAADLRSRAEAQAAQIIEAAKHERARLIESAAETGHKRGYDAGFEEGRAAGHAQGREAGLAAVRKSSEPLAAAWQAALDEFSAQRAALLEAARDDAVRLAIAIADRVVKRSVSVDIEMAARQAAAALALLSRATRLRVLVHPNDVEATRAALPRLSRMFASSEDAAVEADASVSPGSCVVRTPGGGEISADVAAQLDALVAAVRPGGSGSAVADAAGGAR